MKLILNLTVLFACLVFLSGCKHSINPEIEGYVVDIQLSRVLVTSYDADAGNLAANNAIWFTGMGKDVKSGQKVKVWTNALQESYPAQGNADNYVIVHTGQESKVLRKALARRLQRGDEGTPFVVDIKKGDDDNSWEVQFTSGPEGKLDTEPVKVTLEE